MPPKKKPAPKKPANPNAVFLRLEDADAEALARFIADQPVPPERTTVILTALRQFLAGHGHYPPRD